MGKSQGQAVVVRGINGTDVLVTPDGKIAVSGDFAVSIHSGDIQIGAVEIKDSVNNSRVEVNPSGALKVSGDLSITGGSTEATLSTLLSRISGDTAIGAVELIDSVGTNRAKIYSDGAVRVSGDVNTTISSVTITDINIPSQSTDLNVSLNNEKIVVESGDITIGGTVSATQSGNWDVNDISKGTQTNDLNVSLNNEKIVVESGDIHSKIWNGTTEATINADGSIKISGDVNLVNGDIQIGAVELKDGIDNNRAEINASRALKVSGDVTIGANTITDVNIPSQSTDLSITLDSEKLVIESGDITIGGTVAISGTPSVIVTGITVPIDVSGDVTVSATNLDIRDLTSVSDNVEVKQATATNLKAQINIDTNDQVATQLSGDTAKIVTAVELLDNSVDGDYLNTNINIAGIDVTTNAGTNSAQTQRVTIATDDPNISGISGDIRDVKISLEAIDDWEDTGNFIDHTKSVTYLDNGGNPVRFSGDINGRGQIDVYNISKGTQTNDVKVTLDNEKVVIESGDISGTVTANAGTNLNTSALNLQTTQVAVSGDIARVRDAVETIDNAISGNEILIAGGATQSADVKVTLDSEKVVIASGDINARIWDGTNNATIHPDGAQKVSGDIRLVSITSVVSNRKVVASPGTAEAFVAVSTPCYRVDVCADMGNTEGPMAVGDSAVVAANGSQKGILLIPGNAPVTLYIDNLTKLYADSQASGDAICYNYYTR